MRNVFCCFRSLICCCNAVLSAGCGVGGVFKLRDDGDGTGA